MRRLQTMAESTQRLSEELTAQTVNIDWRAIAGFWNVLVHDYNVLVHDYIDGIDLQRVWDAVKNYLPELEATVRQLLETED